MEPNVYCPFCAYLLIAYHRARHLLSHSYIREYVLCPEHRWVPTGSSVIKQIYLRTDKQRDWLISHRASSRSGFTLGDSCMPVAWSSHGERRWSNATYRSLELIPETNCTKTCARSNNKRKDCVFAPYQHRRKQCGNPRFLESMVLSHPSSIPSPNVFESIHPFLSPS